MARNGQVNIDIQGDGSDAIRAFEDVGDGARDMSRDVDRATRDSSAGFDKLGDGVDASEGKFRGFGDTIGGTSDIMQGFKDGNLVGVAMGFADLAGGISQFVLPALIAVKGFIMTSLLPALTAVATHPLFLAILAGGAIIAGLILLEKKFGVVSGAIEGLKDVAATVFSAISSSFKTMANLLLGGLEWIANAAIDAYTLPIGVLNKIPGVKNIIPDVPDLRLPRLHSGGVVGGAPGSESLALLQAGERVIPAGGGGAGVTIIVNGALVHERDLGRYIADAQRGNALIGVTS